MGKEPVLGGKEKGMGGGIVVSTPI